MAERKKSQEIVLILTVVIFLEFLFIVSALHEFPGPGTQTSKELPPITAEVSELGISECIRILKSPGNEELKRKVLRELPKFGRQGRAAIPCLREMLENRNRSPENYHLMIEASAALAMLRGEEEVMNGLISALNSGNGFSQESAAERLIAYGRKASNAVPILMAQLSQNSNAGRALATINPDKSGLAERLGGLAVSKSTPQAVRLGSLDALGSLGTRATGSVERICSLLNPALNEGSAISPVKLSDSDRWQSAVITALGQIGPGAQTAVSRLKPFLTNTSITLRILAARALWQITADPKPLVPALRKILEEDTIDPGDGPVFAYGFDAGDSNSNLMRRWTTQFHGYVERVPMRWSATVYLLGEMGEAAEPALPVLKRIRKNMQDCACLEELITVRAVSKITGDSSEFLSVLLKELNSDSKDAAHIRVSVINFLAEFGPAAQAGLNRLQVLSTNKELAIAFAATNAIQRISSPALTNEALPLKL